MTQRINLDGIKILVYLTAFHYLLKHTYFKYSLCYPFAVKS
jgi:hypothetical protein